MYFYMLLLSLSLSCSNGTSSLWQMVHMRTGNFAQDVNELSNTRAGEMMNELRTAAHGTHPPPPPPPPPVSIEQLLAT
jgi:hypothetical protein